MNKTEAKKLLFDFADIFNKYKIEFFLSHGTLLGAIRDKDIIEGDNDIDLGAFVRFWDDWRTFGKVTKELEQKNIKITNIYGNGIIHFHRQNAGIDVYIYQKNEEKNVYFIIEQKIFLYPINIVMPLSEIKFLEKIFKIPHNPIELLRLEYGNWKTYQPKAIYGTNKIFFESKNHLKGTNFIFMRFGKILDKSLDETFKFRATDFFDE